MAYIREIIVVYTVYTSIYISPQSLGEHEDEIPETIKTQQLVKDLAKEIRLVEVSEYQIMSVSAGRHIQHMTEPMGGYYYSIAVKNRVFGYSTAVDFKMLYRSSWGSTQTGLGHYVIYMNSSLDL